jgi:hypothetical protein
MLETKLFEAMVYSEDRRHINSSEAFLVELIAWALHA